MSDLLQLPGIRNRARPLSVEAWQGMIASGLAPQRAELLEGVIVEKMSKSILHTRLLSRTMDALQKCLQQGCWLRQEAPISTTHSEPEPDISIVVGSELNYTNHPNTALLVIEISVSTVAEDRAMASIYAEADVAEYWLFNAPAREVEVFRKPVDGTYSEKIVVAADQILMCESIANLSLDLAPLWASLPS
jgi:Uma2 family endonuclease